MNKFNKRTMLSECSRNDFTRVGKDLRKPMDATKNVHYEQRVRPVEAQCMMMPEPFCGGSKLGLFARPPLWPQLCFC